jgi:two-component system cell cycle sensor histidine kinase/response regulator CckA
LPALSRWLSMIGRCPYGLRKSLEPGCGWYIVKNVMNEPDKQAENQHFQKMEAIRRFAGGVAHVFNNTLMVVDGFTGLLCKDLEQGDRRLAYCREIRNAVDRASALTQRLLAFGRDQELREEIDLNEIIMDADKKIRGLIGEEIELCLNLDPKPALARSGKTQIVQALMHLVTNAREAMPQGGRLAITTNKQTLGPDDQRRRSFLRPGDYVVLEITDTGVGMEPEIQEHIFEPFFSTKEDRGAGMGLTVAYGTAKQSEGYILCDSTPGRGTTFRIYLPRVQNP